MTKKKLTYNEAVEEINQIIAEIESGITDIDMITTKIKRAKELIEFCQKKLRNLEDSIKTEFPDD